MKKICFLSGDITRSGGTERVTSDIVNALSCYKNKYEVHVLSIIVESETPFFYYNSSIVQARILNSNIESAIIKYIKIVLGIHDYITKNSIDILIDVDTILDIFSLPASMFTKTKLISWEHFHFFEDLGIKKRRMGRLLASKYSQAIVTITKEDQEYFINNLKPKCPMYQIYNPISNNNQKINYSNESKVIISAGRITHQKGFDLLVDVAKIALYKHNDWKWFILGDGEDRENIEKKIRDNNLEQKLILCGTVRNIEDYYRNASMFILTSRFEGFGLVLTEAKAYGLPCVSFRCKCGPSEIILDGINGFLIDCFDIEQMADRICTLIEDEDLRIKFSSHAKDDTEKFEIENIIPQWVKVFDEVLGSRGFS